MGFSPNHIQLPKTAALHLLIAPHLSLTKEAEWWAQLFGSNGVSIDLLTLCWIQSKEDKICTNTSPVRGVTKAVDPLVAEWAAFGRAEADKLAPLAVPVHDEPWVHLHAALRVLPLALGEVFAQKATLGLERACLYITM